MTGACRKYLTTPANRSMMTPISAADFQAMLDNQVMTENVTPGLGPMGTDDYALVPPVPNQPDIVSWNAYSWNPNIFDGSSSKSWDNSYHAILVCNEVLEGLGTATDSLSQVVRGSALFYRAFYYYDLEETFGQPYRPGYAMTDAGVILRLDPDPGQQAGRATVATVYGQILQDLRQAVPLLPADVPWTKRNRPSRPAALALLAKVYLTCQNYIQARAYADSCLGLYGVLAKYDTVKSAMPRPFSAAGNQEVLFQCSSVYYQGQALPAAVVDSALYASYDSNDLRRVIFFRTTTTGAIYFKGHYTGTASYIFSGLATDEIYLIRAECQARIGTVDQAMQDLDTLLIHRWRDSTFRPYTASTSAQALTLVLMEKRKETLFREGRWADLRRLNQSPATADTLRRLLSPGAQPLLLLPGDPRYTYPIPANEIQQSGILQNPR